MDRLGHRNNAAAEEIAHQNTNDNGDEIEPNASLHHVADADASGTEDNGVRGVPTGIIKAQDAAKTVAKRIGSGLKCRLPAAASITGIMVAANAVLEVTSETKVTIVETPNIMGSSPILQRPELEHR